MTICNLCDSDCSKQSYFIRDGEGMDAQLIEVCPECHHFYKYGTEEQLENYKKRRNIKL